MRYRSPHITSLLIILFCICYEAHAQSGLDTLRVGCTLYNGKIIPAMLLPETDVVRQMINPEERKRINNLRNAVYTTYPYALAAAAILKDVNTKLDQLPDKRSRKKYLKEINRQLDATFKEPLKNMSIDQGHVLIKLINRQAGENVYDIIKELKGGLNAMVWQSVGVFFNNNLNHDYDPEGKDKEIETIVRELETSNAYRYQLYQQEVLLRKIPSKH